MDKLSNKILRINLVRTIDESYDLVLDTDFPEIAADLKKRDFTRKFGIVTDTKVGPLYAGELQAALKSEGLEAEVFAFEEGEPNKTWDTTGRILNKMVKAKYGRDSGIIALGGGVVGDVGGFAASVTRRGVPCVQIPTSTTALADSAIGGKTGVDLEEGKNLAGRIVQPVIVYFVFRTLDTLDDRNYRSGLAETVKHGVIQSKELFEYMEKNAHLILGRNRDALTYITEMNCMVKGTVVEIDPDEEGLRRILNYGHTVGHAVETLSSYKLTHGEAVAIGTVPAGRLAIMLGTGFTEDDLERNIALFEKLGFSTKIPGYIPTADIVKKTGMDKKAKDGKARYCMASGPGSMCEFGGAYATHVEPEMAAEAIEMSR